MALPEKTSTLPLSNTVAPVPATLSVEDPTADDMAPSREALLQRAAELGPRLTLDNIMMAPTDPILAEKMQPRAAQRRARFRTVVKVAVGLCAGFSLIAAAAALSSSASAATPSSIQMQGSVPAAAVVPVEKLEIAPTTKASKAAAEPAATPAPAPAQHAARATGRRAKR